MVIKAACIGLIVLLAAGCSARGLLYTSTTEPYSRDFHNTPVGTKFVVINSHRLKEPLSQLNISGEWDTDVIMQAAREAGITNLHHIDIKTLSIVLGTYRRQTLIVYGD